MKSLWLVAAVMFIVAGLVVTWVTAFNPIMGNRGLNWLAMMALYGMGAWCSWRGQREQHQDSNGPL